MNFLKKKLKPLGLNYGTTTSTATTSGGGSKKNTHTKDLEDDLYDEYVVEAPPHPSELLALGVDPSEIDVNDPQKLRDLYRKAKEEGKCGNSVLLARERQKEEIEAKKKTREEWKFFENLSARVEQAVKDSQKTLEQLKESSAIDELTQPDYDLVLSPDQVFKSSAGIKREKSIKNWTKFSEDGGGEASTGNCKKSEPEKLEDARSEEENKQTKVSVSPAPTNFVVEELLNDFGLDLRSEEQKRQAEAELLVKRPDPTILREKAKPIPQHPPAAEPKLVARPRPRPNSRSGDTTQPANPTEVDPFDTSFIAPHENCLPQLPESPMKETQQTPATTLATTTPDPFDTSFVNF